jgi:Tol biopolymer transport system component
MSPMDIEIEDRGLKWNLKDYLEGKERTGAARHPAWSPDGKTIAFFVTIYGIREDPSPKYNVNYDLFFMDSSTLKPVPELMDVADAGKIVWSPNNEYLLFRGCIGRRLTCGLWRYRISDKTLSLIEEGESFADYIWITNNKVVAIKDTDIFSDGSEIWEYSISE